MNWVIARCSCGQSCVLQCKSFKLLCVIPDLFFSFKHKPDQHGSTFQGEEKPLILPIFPVAFAWVLRGFVVFFIFLFCFFFSFVGSWLVLVLSCLFWFFHALYFHESTYENFMLFQVILHIILKVIFCKPGMIILRNPRSCLAR